MKSALQDFFETWPDMVSMYTADGFNEYVNSAWTKELGWTKEDLYGKHFLSYIFEADRERAEKEAAAVFGGKAAVSFEFRFLHKNGTPRWIRVAARFMPELNRFFIIHYDIEAEKKREEELRLGQSFFQQVIDAFEEFVLVKGPHSKLLWANKAFQNYYGMTNEQLVGLIDAPFSAPDNTQQYVKDDEYVFTQGKTLHIPCEPVTRHDGVIRKFYTVKNPIFNEKGEVIMTVGISRDITDALAAQAKVIESAKMATLGEMAAGIAHEINNPLAVILGRTSAMRDKAILGKLTPKEYVEECDKIEKMIMRIAKIVKGLRSFSRDSEEDPFVMESMSVIVEDALSLCQEKFARKRIELRVSPIVPTQIECRPSQISQVLLNLLANSIDAVECINEKWVELKMTEVSQGVEFTVTDSGKGIPVENRKRIMEPFYTTKEVGKGTGLGLSISHSIVEGHGGTLIYNEVSPNTQFIVRLPKLQTSAPIDNEPLRK